MKSIGINLEQWEDKGLLKFHATRPSLYGLELHLVTIYKLVNDFQPETIIFDPISNLITVGNETEVKSMLTRLIDFLKNKQITALSTSLSLMGQVEADIGVSSLMDTWINLKATEDNGERNRTIDIIKSRGMEHSNQLREFILTDNGIKLEDIYLGPEGMLTGSARVSQVALEEANKLSRQQEIEQKQREIERERALRDAKITEVQTKFKAKEEELERIIQQEKLKEEVLVKDRVEMAKIRKLGKEGD